ncbi:MAG: hypothetical protein IJH77_05295 [Mogibacterium sp.]|nr:hypothetical protein [Mogibacterium sp.]
MTAAVYADEEAPEAAAQSSMPEIVQEAEPVSAPVEAVQEEQPAAPEAQESAAPTEEVTQEPEPEPAAEATAAESAENGSEEEPEANAEPDTVLPDEETAAEAAETAEPEDDGEEESVITDEETAEADPEAEAATVSTAAGWVSSDGGKRYYYTASDYYTSALKSVDGKLYYFDANGYVTYGVFKADGVYRYADTSSGAVRTTQGWITWNSKRYYSNAEGVLYSGRFISVSGKKYYMTAAASAATGIFQTAEAAYYYADSTGLVTTAQGWITVSGKKYYAAAGGQLYANRTISVSGRKYHMAPAAYVITGIHKWEGDYYYSDSAGVLRTAQGWVTSGYLRYYAASGGKLYHSRTLSVNGVKYHLATTAYVIYGVHKWGNDYYYSPSSAYGAVRTTQGWITWGGKRYYSAADGTLYHGRMISVNGAKYYMGADAAVVTGTYSVGNYIYTTDSNGKVVTATYTGLGHSSFLKGIDVSYWQGTINWTKVKAAGIQFAILRCAYRTESSGELNTDSTFVTNMKGAQAAGIPVGVYIYSQAINASEGVAEANYAINLIEKSGCKSNVKYPVVIDSEGSSSSRLVKKATVTSRTAAAAAFCEQVIKKGYTPMIYASTSWLNNKLDMTKLRKYKVWVAQYYKEVTYEGPYQCWQYTSSGSVNGISGRVDMNYWYLTK